MYLSPATATKSYAAIKSAKHSLFPGTARERMQSVTPADLPPEMWDEIFARCDRATLSALARVDRAWHAKVKPYIFDELWKGLHVSKFSLSDAILVGKYGSMRLNHWLDLLPVWDMTSCQCCLHKATDERNRVIVIYDHVRNKSICNGLVTSPVVPLRPHKD